MPSSPSQRYQAWQKQGRIQACPEQQALLPALDAWVAQVRPHLSRPTWWPSFSPPPPSLYLWGRVGSGKTTLSQILAECFPTQRCMRLHAQAWLAALQAQLHILRGHPDPISTLAKAQPRGLWIIDEFAVHDIADALMLGQFLTTCWDRGIPFVFTSNTPPQDLYAGGLQRRHFLPTIQAIHDRCQILPLQTPEDWRTQTPGRIQCLSSEAWHALRKARGVEYQPQTLTLMGRPVRHEGCHAHALWLTWTQALTPPRCYHDYLILAKNYSTIMLSDCQPIPSEDRATWVNWVHWMDIMVDHPIELILETDDPEALIALHSPDPRYARLHSRLLQASTDSSTS